MITGSGYALYNNDKTLHNGGSAIIRSGNLGNGLRFDGVNDYVETTNAPTEKINNTDAATVHLVVTPDMAIYAGLTYYYGVIAGDFTYDLADANLTLILHNESGAWKLMVDLRYGGIYQQALFGYNGGILADGSTYHITIVKQANAIDFDDITVYINGEVQTRQVVNSNGVWTGAEAAVASQPLRFGSAAGSFYGKMYLHTYQIYSGAATDDEALELYSLDGGLSTSLTLRHAWNFDEREGTTAYEVNGNHGTLTNYTPTDVQLGVNNKWVNAYSLSPILV